MLNNINPTQSPTFGANLNISTVVKNNARLQNIQKIFAERTPEFKETLSLTRLGEEWQNYEYIHVGTNAETDIGSFFRSSLDTMMDSLSDNEIVTKFIKGLKAIKEVKKKDSKTVDFENELYKAKHEQKRNMLIANNCHEKGDEVMAKRFEFLANCFAKKIEKINNESNKINRYFSKKIDAIADGDEDIIYFKDCFN